MAVLESIKERFENVTGWARPCGRDLKTVLRQRKANAFRFKDGWRHPEQSKAAFVLYRSPDKAKVTGWRGPKAAYSQREPLRQEHVAP
jgi:hypothetical protein